MSAELVGHYLTRSGKDGAKVYAWRHGGRVSYGYSGAWGAGSTTDPAGIQHWVNVDWMRRRGVRVVVPFAPLA